MRALTRGAIKGVSPCISNSFFSIALSVNAVKGGASSERMAMLTAGRVSEKGGDTSKATDSNRLTTKSGVAAMYPSFGKSGVSMKRPPSIFWSLTA